MKRAWQILGVLWLIGALTVTGLPAVFAQEAPALPSDALRSAIEEKAKELDAITKKIQDAQINLTDTQVRGKTLKQQINKIDSNVQSVNLNIQLSELTIQQLSQDMTATQRDIAVKEAEVEIKRNGVGQLLQNLREKEEEGMLLPLLAGLSLAQSISESQSISDIQGGLLAEVDELRTLKDRLLAQMDAAANKKKSIQQKKSALQTQKSIALDQLTERQQLLVATKDKESNYQKLITNLQKQQESISEEIGDIEDKLRAQYGTATLPGKRPGVFARPVDAGIITQKYGSTPYSKKLYRNGVHNGIDFGTTIGTQILAAEDGIVQIAGNNGKLQYGKYILIRHDNGLSTIYAHLSRQVVKTGSEVKRGEIIGYSGNTGYAFGPHLHFGAYLSSTVKLQQVSGAGLVPVGYTLDPLDYL
jgi:murein DD-endopeptidase MepM/ murein hydrolase activator NlpD